MGIKKQREMGFISSNRDDGYHTKLKHETTYNLLYFFQPKVENKRLITDTNKFRFHLFEDFDANCGLRVRFYTLHVANFATGCCRCCWPHEANQLQPLSLTDPYLMKLIASTQRVLVHLQPREGLLIYM